MVMVKQVFEIGDGDKCLPYLLDIQDEVKYITDENLIDLESILDDAYILGIDTETRPSFFNRKTKFGWYPTSIIQIAIRTKAEREYVVIVDLLNLSTNKVSLCRLDKILIKSMRNTDVVKVGQGLENDFRELCSSYPSLTAFKDVPSIIDTNVLLRHLQPEIKQDTSLKNLTRHFLDCNLIKTMQCSDWARRPLSSAQLDYAARDALVLLRLFDAMTCEAIEKGNFSLTLLLRRFQNGVSSKVLKIAPVGLIGNATTSEQIPSIKSIPSIHTHFDESPFVDENSTQVPSNYYNSSPNKGDMLGSNSSNDSVCHSSSSSNGNIDSVRASSILDHLDPDSSEDVENHSSETSSDASSGITLLTEELETIDIILS
jgi:acyl-CoA-binding protein